MKKKLLSSLSFILLTLIVISCQINKEDAPTYNVTFKVLDGDKPLPNATVSMNNISNTTNSAGEVSFKNLETGRFYYSIHCTDYNPIEDGSITINDADIIETVNLDLTLIEYVISVVNDKQIQIANAHVEFKGYEPKTTDANGKVTFAVVPNSNTQLTITADGFATYTDDEYDIPNFDFVKSITLRTAYNLTFKVMKNNKPIAGAKVNIKEAWESITKISSTTDENGIVTFKKILPKNTLYYTVEKGNQGNYEFISTTESDMNIDVEMVNIAKDIVGNMYKVVTIGTQYWMASNLRTTKFNDGTDIPEIVIDNAWSNATSSALCWFEYLGYRDFINYGALYNWYCVDTEKLCPEGWHVPTVDEWNTLETFIKNDKGDENVGGFMKSTEDWNQNLNGTDDYGLAIYPAGQRVSTTGSSSAQHNGAMFWLREASTNNYALYNELHYLHSYIGNGESPKWNGYSIRCIADSSKVGSNL